MSPKTTAVPSAMIKTIVERGLALYREGRYDSAEIMLAMVSNEPSVKAFAQHIRGLCALATGRRDLAAQFLRESIEADPSVAEAHANLGVVLLEDEKYATAFAAYEAALFLKSDAAPTHFGLARAAAELQMTDLAIDSYRDALALDPDYAEAELNLGLLLNDAGESAAAIELLRRALERYPARADFHAGLGLCLLSAGAWSEAWPEYEWRWADPRMAPDQAAGERPYWRGEALAGRTILLEAEQGFGDTLFFLRYVPMVKALGCRVLLSGTGKLSSLVRAMPTIDEVIGNDQPLPQSDFRALLGSLPGIFGTRPDDVPSQTPYLRADPALADQWRIRLGSHGGLSVGLCWQGNPAYSKDRHRSIPLDALRPLLDCAEARFVSLQVGPGREQLAEMGGRVHDLAADIDAASFEDAAAIISTLDLVITVDSAIAHLAAALGKPVWLLIAANGDWRWRLDESHSRWYPTARLFRQARLGDWYPVVAELRSALWSLAGHGDEAPPLRPAPARPATQTLVDALFMAGGRHHRAGNHDRARKSFERALSLDPDHVNTLCNLAALERMSGDDDRARQLLERTVALAPDLKPARAMLADLLRMSGELEASAEQYRLALVLAPEDPTLHAMQALVLQGIGDVDGAAAHFRKAAEINPQKAFDFLQKLTKGSAAQREVGGLE
ncbi:MAG TPA: tetratricopeptide repeat protein [Aliidongia sp.]|nr:tetratricopeptide repeat protein [Aliidongia sp.]